MQLSNEATDADITALIDGLEALPGVVPELRNFSVGLDAGLVEGNYHLVLIADFDDEEGFARYNSNDEHQTVIAERIRPLMTSRSAVQYFLD